MHTDSELARERVLLVGKRASMGVTGGSDEERVEEIVRNILRDYVEYGRGVPLEVLVAEARRLQPDRSIYRRESER